MPLRLMAAAGITTLALDGGYLQAGTASSLEPGLVASVYDGGHADAPGGRRIRLVQIDTPELGSGECYSRALPALSPGDSG
jgi:endonuclease YncB( thermonuclease family)